MSLGLYMDVHVHSAITRGVRLRGVDVLTAQDDGSRRLSDPELIDRATELNRVMFSQDRDMLIQAAARQRAGQFFTGIIYADQLGITIGRCINDLELIAGVYDPSDMANQVQRLPLK